MASKKHSKTATKKANSDDAVVRKTTVPSKGATKRQKKSKPQEAVDSPPAKRVKLQLKIKSVDILPSVSKTPAPVTFSMASTSNASDNKDDVKPDAINYSLGPLCWTTEDSMSLISKIEHAIPDCDNIAYYSRAISIDWNKISFDNYNANECKRQWEFLVKRVRRFRLLREILNDVKDTIVNPASPALWGKKKRLYRRRRIIHHPEMPRKPASVYILFYMDEKIRLTKQNPGMDRTNLFKVVGESYRNMPQHVREGYEMRHNQMMEEYANKLRDFRAKYPNYQKLLVSRRDRVRTAAVQASGVKRRTVNAVVKRVRTKQVASKRLKQATLKLPKVDKPPKRPPIPFSLFYRNQFDANRDIEECDKAAFRRKCKVKWKHLGDEEKIKWIIAAEERERKFEEEMSAYKEAHPDYEGCILKSVLTKEELALKERLAGRPVKPPISAYSLFYQQMLENETIRNIATKDRTHFISNEWKNASADLKSKYREKVTLMMQQYKQNFAKYLETLPEYKRKQAIESSKRKRNYSRRPKKTAVSTKTTEFAPSSHASKRSGKSTTKKTSTKNASVRSTVKRSNIRSTIRKPKKLTEPEAPPRTADRYFAMYYYKGTGNPMTAWNILSSAQKQQYDKELTAKKEAYIADFEKFLTSLTKEELEAYSRAKSQCSSDCSSTEEDSGSSEESDDEDEKRYSPEKKQSQHSAEVMEALSESMA